MICLFVNLRHIYSLVYIDNKWHNISSFLTKNILPNNVITSLQ